MAKDKNTSTDVTAEITATFKGDRTLSVVYVKGDEYSFNPRLKGNKEYAEMTREDFVPVVEKKEKPAKK